MSNSFICDGVTGSSAEVLGRKLQVSSSGGVASGATDSGNPVKVGGVYNSTPPTFSTGQRGDLQLTDRGNAKVEVWSGASPIAFATGTASDGAAVATGLKTTPQPFIFNGTTWDRHRKPNAVSRILSAAADTNPTSAKASAGDVHRVNGYNAAASARYLKFYNKASAPTVGTDTPVLTLYLAATARFEFDLGGQYFGTGIAYGMSTGVADADTGALTAADVLALNITYA